jgi:hypothetical protein
MRITIAHHVLRDVGVLAVITARRAIILVFVLGVTFLIAHTINAVIAEALFIPPGVA